MANIETVGRKGSANPVAKCVRHDRKDIARQKTKAPHNMHLVNLLRSWFDEY